MSDERPRIFDITYKFRQTFGSVIENALASNRANDMSLKNILYILRCQMSEERLYRPLSGAVDTPDYNGVQFARVNFARLYKQCDVLDILPAPALGLIRSSYPMALLPVPSHTQSDVAEMLDRHRAVALDALSSYSRFLVIYVSNFGISEAVSLPTLSIILPDLTSACSISIVSRLKELFDPFNYTGLLRLASGEFKPVGEIWYYPRVPLGSSISGGDDGTTGTLGGFCWNKSTGEVYGLTAAHVVGTSPRDVFAPASKPYNETAKSLEIRAKDTEKAGKGGTLWSNKLSQLKGLDRFYGTSLFASQKCTDDARIIDCNWGASNVTRADEKAGGTLCMPSGIVGQRDPSEGTFTDFAKPVDSGSLVLRVVRDPSGSVESEAVVIRTEGAGLLYGIVWEEKHQ